MNEQMRRGLFTKLTGKLASVEGGMYRGFCAGIGNSPVFEAFEAGQKQEREQCAEIADEYSRSMVLGNAEQATAEAIGKTIRMRSNAELRGAKPIGEASLSNDVLGADAPERN